MSKDTGGPAFPCHTNPQPGRLSDAPQGMTMRDYFAAAALQGTLSSPQIRGNTGQENWRHQDFAEFAYRLADAMLAERASQSTQEPPQ